VPDLAELVLVPALAHPERKAHSEQIFPVFITGETGLTAWGNTRIRGSFGPNHPPKPGSFDDPGGGGQTGTGIFFKTDGKKRRTPLCNLAKNG